MSNSWKQPRADASEKSASVTGAVVVDETADRRRHDAWRRRSAAQAVAAWELLWWATEPTLASCYPRGRPTSDARENARGRRIPIRADLHAIDATLIPSSRRLI
jgi:hypothetical protein